MPEESTAYNSPRWNVKCVSFRSSAGWHSQTRIPTGPSSRSATFRSFVTSSNIQWMKQLPVHELNKLAELYICHAHDWKLLSGIELFTQTVPIGKVIKRPPNLKMITIRLPEHFNFTKQVRWISSDNSFCFRSLEFSRINYISFKTTQNRTKPHLVSQC